MGEGFNVSVDEVRSHAQTVGNIAANVQSAAGSASDSVSGGAFGQIAEFFASAITSAADVVRQSMTDAGQTVGQVQTGLNQVADNYQAIEDEHVRVFAIAGAGGGSARRKVAKKAKELKTLTDTQSGAVKTIGEAQSPAKRRS